MPLTHPASLPDDALMAQCEIRFTRRSGPGGQHRNKVETAVLLKHIPSGQSAEANERRSQSENRRQALFRLRVKLALEIRQPVEEIATPSALWTAHCRRGRIAINPSHTDFPTVLAEALDTIAVCGFELPPAAARLGCTSSQLLKLLKLESAAMAQVNESRRILRLRPLA